MVYYNHLATRTKRIQQAAKMLSVIASVDQSGDVGFRHLLTWMQMRVEDEFKKREPRIY